MSQNDLSRSPAAGGGLKLVCSLDLVLISDPHLKEFIFLIISWTGYTNLPQSRHGAEALDVSLRR